MARLCVQAVTVGEVRPTETTRASAQGASSFTSPTLAVSLPLEHTHQSPGSSAVHATHDLQHTTKASDHYTTTRTYNATTKHHLPGPPSPPPLNQPAPLTQPHTKSACPPHSHPSTHRPAHAGSGLPQPARTRSKPPASAKPITQRASQHGLTMLHDQRGASRWCGREMARSELNPKKFPSVTTSIAVPLFLSAKTGRQAAGCLISDRTLSLLPSCSRGAVARG